MDPIRSDIAKGTTPPAPAAGSPSRPSAPARMSSGDGSLGGGLRVSLMLSGDQEGEVVSMRRRITVLLLVLVVETLVLGIGYFAILTKESSLKSDRGALEQELARVQTQIAASEAEAKDMVRFNRQIAAANALLDGHTYWTSVFAYIESKTRANVTYTNFAGDAASGVLTMDAIGRSYRDVAEQIVAFRDDPLVLDISTRSASASIDGTGALTGVTFSVVLKLSPGIWAKGALASAPTATTGTSIRILTPEDELSTTPSASVPDTRIISDPGASGGATAPQGPFMDAEEVTGAGQ
jgi:hypothetical protein